MQSFIEARIMFIVMAVSVWHPGAASHGSGTLDDITYPTRNIHERRLAVATCAGLGPRGPLCEGAAERDGPPLDAHGGWYEEGIWTIGTCVGSNPIAQMYRPAVDTFTGFSWWDRNRRLAEADLARHHGVAIGRTSWPSVQDGGSTTVQMATLFEDAREGVGCCRCNRRYVASPAGGGPRGMSTMVSALAVWMVRRLDMSSFMEVVATNPALGRCGVYPAMLGVYGDSLDASWMPINASGGATVRMCGGGNPVVQIHHPAVFALSGSAWRERNRRLMEAEPTRHHGATIGCTARPSVQAVAALPCRW